MGIFDQIVSFINNMIVGPPKRRRTAKSASRRRKSSLRLVAQKRRPGKYQRKSVRPTRDSRKRVHPALSAKSNLRARVKTKVAVSRSRRKSSPGPKAAAEKIKMVYVGEVTHYFSKIMVCVVAVKGKPLQVGDRICIKGGNEFTQDVKSLQVESRDVKVARKGQLVGLKVERVVRVGDAIFRT